MSVEFRVQKKALLCIDGSEHSMRAFRWYLNKIHSSEDEVLLVHVHEPPNLPIGVVDEGLPGSLEFYYTAIESSAKVCKDLMAKYEKICKQNKVCCKTFMQSVDDTVGHTICKFAEDMDVNFIVMGQRGLGIFRRTFFGSISDYVLHHSAIPVMVVPPSPS